MPRWECPVCHGTYDDPQRNGAMYFHACPPLSNAELERMDRATVLGLVPELPAAYRRADLDRVLLARDIERPGARNENIVSGQIIRIYAAEPHPDVPAPRAKQDQPPRIRKNG